MSSLKTRNKINELKVGALLSYLSMLLGYIIAIVYTPIMLRLLGQSEYGLYNLVISVVSYLGVLSFGFGSSYMRYFSRFKVQDNNEGVAKLNGMFFIIFSIIGIIAAFAGFMLAINVKQIFGDKLTSIELDTAKKLMLVLIFNMSISFPTSVFNSYIIANEKYIFQTILQIGKTVISPFIMLPVLLMGYKSIGVVSVTTTISILIEMVNIFYCFRYLKIKFIFRQFDFLLMKEMTVFSSYIFINMIIDQINWNVDKFIVGRYRGTVEVAIYGLAAQLNTYYISLSTALSNLLIPRVNKLIANSSGSDQISNLFIKVGRIQFILLSLVCSGLVFFGRPFIYMWAGESYTGVYPILLLLIIPITIPLIQNLGIEIQKAKNMHQFRTWVYFIIALSNITLSIPFTKLYGGAGAALGTAISLLVGNGLIMNWYYNKKVGLNIKFFWAQIVKIVPGLIIPIITGFMMNLYINLYNVTSFIISGITYVILFCFSMWIFGMNQYEKDIFSKPLMKVIQKSKH